MSDVATVTVTVEFNAGTQGFETLSDEADDILAYLRADSRVRRIRTEPAQRGKLPQPIEAGGHVSRHAYDR